jgi:hypothetical protein
MYQFFWCLKMRVYIYNKFLIDDDYKIAKNIESLRGNFDYQNFYVTICFLTTPSFQQFGCILGFLKYSVVINYEFKILYLKGSIV